MRPIPRNTIASGDYFGKAAALSGERALIGTDESDEMGDGSGVAYIFHRVDGVWQEESKLVPTDEASYDEFGRDVDLSGYTDIIGSPFDSDMGNYSGSVYFFFRWDSEKWEELQKLNPTDGEADDEF